MERDGASKRNDAAFHTCSPLGAYLGGFFGIPSLKQIWKSQAGFEAFPEPDLFSLLTETDIIA